MQSSRSVHNPNSRINAKTLYNYFINDWEQNRAQHSNGKLCTYVTFKTNFGCEKYLFIISSFDLRRCLSRLRLSAHALPLKKADIRVLPDTIEHVPDVIAVKLKMKSIFSLTAIP